MEATSPVSGQPTILIVEDRSLMRIVLGNFLRDALPGCAILEAADGAVALELHAAYRPDVVLMDIGLPDVDGLDLTERLKAAQPDIPIIVISYFNDAFHAERAHAAGACAFVGKDSLHRNLMPAIADCVGKLEKPEAERIAA